MNNILFMYISTTGIHAFLQSAGWGLARLNWGNLLPTEYKKDADAAVPLSDLKASYTRTKDNDNSRHPRQSFIYNTSLTNMLIYIRSRGVSTVSSLSFESLLFLRSRDNTLLLHIGNKNRFLPVSSR